MSHSPRRCHHICVEGPLACSDGRLRWTPGLVVCAVTLLMTGCSPESSLDERRGEPRTISSALLSQVLSVEEDEVLEETLLTAEGFVNPTWSITGAPEHGTLTLLNEDTGAFRYTPEDNFEGVDSFAFQVLNGAAPETEPGIATIFVQSVNDPPTLSVNAGLSVISLGQATITSARLQATDVETASEELVYTLDAPPQGGTLNLGQETLELGDAFTQGDINAGDVVYRHQTGASDSFTFTLSDDEGGELTAQAFAITVEANQPPVISDPQAEQGVREGDAVALSVQIDDPEDDLVAVTWDFGDGSPPQSGSPLTSVSHVYQRPGSFTVTVTADDGQNTVNQTLQVNVANVAPTIDEVTAPASADEGSALSFRVVASEPGSAPEALNVTWNFGDGVVLSEAGLLNPSHAYTDEGDGSVEVTVTVDDGDGSPTTATRSITLRNVAPTLDAGDAGSSAEGQQAIFSASAQDPGAVDVLTWCWDFGDGSEEVCGVNLSAPTHIFRNNGAYTVSATVEDGDGGEATDTVAHVVSNAAPSVNLGNDQTVAEGAPVTFTASVTDPGQDDRLSYEWTVRCDEELDEEECEARARFETARTGFDLDDVTITFTRDGQYTLDLRVEDTDGAQGSDTIDVTVNNAAPTVSLVLVSNPIAEGEFAEMTIQASEPGQGPLTVSIDYGEGTQEQDIALSFPYPALNRVLAYPQEGLYTLNVTVRDDNDAEASTSQTLTVNNAAPQITLPPLTGNEGEVLTLAAEVTDVPDDTLTLTWNFGDGAQPLITQERIVNHTYAQDGAYTLTVSVNDGTEVSTATSTVTINNVAPQLALNARGGAEGEALVFTALASDPGAQDTLVYQWDFGDGEAVVESGDDTITHAYADEGEYTVQVTVRDDDDEVTSEAIVSITNVSPSAQAGDDRLAVEGAEVVFGGQATDAGVDDELTLCWDFGDGSDEVCGVDLNNPAHRFRDNGVYTVTLVVTDGDGGEDTDSLIANIRNASPVVEAGPEVSGLEGSAVSLEGEAIEPGRDDVLTWCWDFGDGSDEVCGIDLSAVEHVYVQNGRFNVTLTVDDNDGGTGTDATVVSIANVTPEVTLVTEAPTITEGDTQRFSAVVTDAGVEDVQTWCWDFGDGSQPRCGVDLDTVEHTFTQDGAYTLIVTVDDQDDPTNATLLTTVLNASPRIINSPQVYFRADRDGDTYVFDAATFDPGVEDRAIFTLTPGPGAQDATVNEDGRVSWLNPPERAERYALSLRVEDESGGVGELQWRLQVGYEDLDEDLAPDDCERANPPLDPTVPEDGALDFDGDGTSNAEECLRGTNPTQRDFPSAPLIQSPEDGGEANSRPVALVVVNAVETNGQVPVYDFQLFADAELTELLNAWEAVEETPGQTRVLVPAELLNENAIYWWRARTFADERYGPYTLAASFRFSEIAEAPSTPVLEAPVGRVGEPGARFIIVNPVDPEEDAVSLQIELYEEGEEAPLLTTTLAVDPEAPTSEVSLPGNLEEDRRYTWRARAIDDGGLASPWSQAASFTIDLDNAIPEAPVLLSPRPLALVTPGELRLIARAAEDLDNEEGGLRYTMRLASDASFSTVLAESDELNASPNGEVVWDLRGDAPMLPEDSTIHWEVSVRDNADQGGRASSRFFFSARDDAPGAPELLAPQPDAVLSTSLPSFTWSQVVDPEGAALTYTLQISSDASFNATLTDQTGIVQGEDAQVIWAGTALPDDQSVFWRVRAVVEGAPGPWSEGRRLSINQRNDAPSTPTPVGPVEGQVLSEGDAVVLRWTRSEDPDGSPVSYEVEVLGGDGSPRFQSVVENAPPSAEEISQGIDGALDAGGYVWRVRASDGVQVGRWSSRARFTIAPVLVEDRPPSAPATISQPQAGCQVTTPVRATGSLGLLWAMLLAWVAFGASQKARRGHRPGQA